MPSKSILECTRCGLCCVACTCGIGEEALDGLCKHLSIDENEITTCKMIADNKIQNLFNPGCTLKYVGAIDMIREYYGYKYDILKGRSK